ncbi:2-keto-4-pentenoate hydratase [Salinicoccus sp. HZC-1]|uniref:2-keto-4-pentenoate hydratase n=1 Tax=Salinicoccus sp. HZC-1 TaxID=3385497 RepID=UPI00398AC66B
MSVTKQLYNAYINNEPLKRGVIGITNLEEAYDVQDEVLDMKIENGEEMKGYKISLTSKETQDLFKSEQPLYGGMTDRTIMDSISLGDFNIPLLEMELVFIVDEIVFPEDNEEDILRKCRVAPGAEVPDGRYEDWFPNVDLYEVVADGAVNGAVIFGKPQKFEYEDLDDIKGTLAFNGEVIKEGRSTEVLGHPATAVKWLAKALSERSRTLNAGLFVSAGTFNIPVELKTGKYTVEYENVGKLEFEVSE